MTCQINVLVLFLRHKLMPEYVVYTKEIFVIEKRKAIYPN